MKYYRVTNRLNSKFLYQYEDDEVPVVKNGYLVEEISKDQYLREISKMNEQVRLDHFEYTL